MSSSSLSPIRLATRKSPLALWQATWVAERLQDLGHECELVPLVSQGDNDLRPITSDSGVGLFTKRIQQALIEGAADVAVHSLKDLPTEVVPELQLAAVTDEESAQLKVLQAVPENLAAVQREAFPVGAEVYVARGPIQGVRGRVIAHPKACYLLVEVPSIRQSIRVHVPADWVLRPVADAAG